VVYGCPCFPRTAVPVPALERAGLLSCKKDIAQVGRSCAHHMFIICTEIRVAKRVDCQCSCNIQLQHCPLQTAEKFEFCSLIGSRCQCSAKWILQERCKLLYPSHAIQLMKTKASIVCTCTSRVHLTLITCVSCATEIHAACCSHAVNDN